MSNTFEKPPCMLTMISTYDHTAFFLNAKVKIPLNIRITKIADDQYELHPERVVLVDHGIGLQDFLAIIKHMERR